MMLCRQLLAAIFLAFFARTIAKEDISRYITRYEKVKFVPISPLSRAAMASKESCEDGDKTCASPTTVLLHVFGQSLELRLHRARSIFSSNAKVTMYDNGYEEVSQVSDLMGTSVEGTVREDNASYVFGQLRNGVFDGVIRSKLETFYVERASKFFPQGTEDFNVIVYRDKDVDPCPSNVCAYDADLGPLGPSDRQLNQDGLSGARRDSAQRRRRRPPFKMYNSGVLAKKKKMMMMMNPSSTTSDVPDDVYYVCSCKVIVDYPFFDIVGNGNREHTISEIEVLMREALQVFRQVDVDGDLEYDTLMVIIGEIHIHRSRREPNYELNDQAKSAHDFLDSLSFYDFTDFCIGFAFTYRTFSKNVLGLAYQGDPSPLRIGGACQGPVISQARGRQHYNCGMVTMTNSRSELIPLQMGALVVAHEMAHLFGSSHDDEADALCTPDYRHGGHYVMFSHANRGNSPNNVRLSPCSQRGIMAYLAKKGHCLKCYGMDCMHRVPSDWSAASACSLTTPYLIVTAILVLVTRQIECYYHF